MVIAEFIAGKMSSYIAGGMIPENAARFTQGELAAIYKRNHYSRDVYGAMRVTPPPEAMSIAAARAKCDEAINEILNRCNEKPLNTETKQAPKHSAPVKTEKHRSMYRSSDAVKHALAAGVTIKPFFAKSGDNDPDAYTADPQQITAYWNEGQRRFKAFIRGRFLAIDIDRKPGKPDGLELFYQIFPREILPIEFQNLPGSFPCYVQTPTGGFHLYFRYEGPAVKLRELAQGIEIKEWQITCPGSRRENGEYVLHGELDNAPPLYGLIIDAIEEAKRKKEQAKAERSKRRTKAAPDCPVQYKKSWITLDDLANEAVAANAGNHDRQVCFAGKACRCEFSGADALAYVKSRTDVFGNGADTENTILSVYRDNGGRL
jgi:hypothetical protein